MRKMSPPTAPTVRLTSPRVLMPVTVEDAAAGSRRGAWRRMLRPDDRVLREWYLEDGRTMTEIARSCGVTRQTVNVWLRDADVRTGEHATGRPARREVGR